MMDFKPGDMFELPNGDVGYVVVRLMIPGTYYADDDSDGGEVHKAGPDCVYDIFEDGKIMMRPSDLKRGSGTVGDLQETALTVDDLTKIEVGPNQKGGE